MTTNNNWRCDNCNSFQGKHDIWFEGDICGACVDTVDLFEYPELIPTNIQDILNTFDDSNDRYAECRRILDAIVPLGYSFDWGLDGEPYELVKI